MCWPQARIPHHLQREARGCAAILLWLDCDREGENIAFEVIDIVRASLVPGAPILRARFSAIAVRDVERALASLGPPNAAEARSVDARQELDLKVMRRRVTVLGARV